MKSEDAVPPRTRRYRQRARAAAAEATGERILRVFLRFLMKRWLADITLAQVADASGVTVQTVIRRFGGKAGLLRATSDELERDILARRKTAVPGDVGSAVEVLVDDYEHQGDLVIRLLAQEARYQPLRRLLDHGREVHRAWVAEVFEPWLQEAVGAEREARLRALIVATDIYTWKLLRRDFGLDQASVRETIERLVRGVVGDQAPRPRRVRR